MHQSVIANKKLQSSGDEEACGVSVTVVQQRGRRVSGSGVAECARAGWHSTVWPGSLRPYHYIEVSARWWWHLGAGAEHQTTLTCLPHVAGHAGRLSERALHRRGLAVRHLGSIHSHSALICSHDKPKICTVDTHTPTTLRYTSCYSTNTSLIQAVLSGL